MEWDYAGNMTTWQWIKLGERLNTHNEILITYRSSNSKGTPLLTLFIDLGISTFPSIDNVEVVNTNSTAYALAMVQDGFSTNP